MEYYYWISYGVFIVISIIFIVFVIIFWLFESKPTLITISDKCKPGYEKHQYLLELRINPSKCRKYRFRSSSIGIEVLNTQKKLITRLSISPSTLINGVRIDRTLRIVRVIVLREQQLVDIGFVRLSHNSRSGYLHIISVEIQELAVDGLRYASPVNVNIQLVSPKEPLEKYLFKCNRMSNNGDAKQDMSTLINYKEYVLFIYIFIIIMISASASIKSYTVEKEMNKTCQLTKASMIGSFSGILSALVCMIPILVYRSILRQKYSNTKPSNPWKYYRYLFLFVLLLIGISVGFFCSVFINKEIKDKFDTNTSNTNKTAQMKSDLKEHSICLTVTAVFGLITFSITLALLFWAIYCCAKYKRLDPESSISQESVEEKESITESKYSNVSDVKPVKARIEGSVKLPNETAVQMSDKISSDQNPKTNMNIKSFKQKQKSNVIEKASETKLQSNVLSSNLESKSKSSNVSQ